MKKFLKVFIIVLLVIAVIGVTAYFFFRNLRKKDETTSSIVVNLRAPAKLQLDEDLVQVNALVKEDGKGDVRFDQLIETSEKLDEIVYTLISYYAQSNTEIQNKEITKVYNQTNASRDLLIQMVNEYKKKSTSDFFDRHEGANDMYVQTCSYLRNYATLAKLINNSLNVNRSSDVKFNMFEVYADVVIISLLNINTNSGIKVLANIENLSYMNSKLNIVLSFIDTNSHPFGIEINHFNKYYQASNKIDFAKNLKQNLSSVSGATGTNEQIATYYFKLICGI